MVHNTFICVFHHSKIFDELSALTSSL